MNTNEWQPIETAPIGVPCLFLIQYATCPAVGVWDGKSMDADREHVEVSCGAFCYGGIVMSERHIVPTHWMPLPEPPK